MPPEATALGIDPTKAKKMLEGWCDDEKSEPKVHIKEHVEIIDEPRRAKRMTSVEKSAKAKIVHIFFAIALHVEFKKPIYPLFYFLPK